MTGFGAPTGYLSEAYAAAFAEFGRPLYLPRSGGWLLERQVPGTKQSDCMGLYPLFACQSWKDLGEDLDFLGERLVSVALVADPFGDHQQSDLRRYFPDRLVHFKNHFVIDVSGNSKLSISKHHRYYARRAFRDLEVDCLSDDLSGVLDEWLDLYSTLVRRHHLTGIKAFSKRSFEKQLNVPGLVIIRAREAGRTIGAHLWYLQGEVAYSHLAAFSDRGYDLMAAYALYSAAIDHFRGRVRWLEIGAGAGADSSADDGLTRFKRGWATGTRPVWFCGRILNRARYQSVAAMLPPAQTARTYFPIYRAGELG